MERQSVAKDVMDLCDEGALALGDQRPKSPEGHTQDMTLVDLTMSPSTRRRRRRKEGGGRAAGTAAAAAAAAVAAAAAATKAGHHRKGRNFQVSPKTYTARGLLPSLHT